jgi:signal peptidase II
LIFAADINHEVVLKKHFFFADPKGRILTFFLSAIFIANVGLDQVTKRHAEEALLVYSDPTDSELFQGRSYPVGTLGKVETIDGHEPNYINLKWQYSRNRGAAFSMLANLPDGIRVPFFYGVTALAVVIIALYLKSTPFHHHPTRLGLIFILSGAVGNFLDRLQHGYVIDFVDVDWRIFGWQHDFAIFNVADVCINIGLVLIILDMILKRHEHKSGAKDPDVSLRST